MSLVTTSTLCDASLGCWSGWTYTGIDGSIDQRSFDTPNGAIPFESRWGEEDSCGTTGCNIGPYYNAGSWIELDVLGSIGCSVPVQRPLNEGPPRPHSGRNCLTEGFDGWYTGSASWMLSANDVTWADFSVTPIGSFRVAELVSVPEPASWWLLLAGGAALRRRRRVRAGVV